jgi:hypothetical protein
VLQEEKASIVLENVKLQERLHKFETSENLDTDAIHRYNEARKQLDAAKCEMFTMETCKIPNLKAMMYKYFINILDIAHYYNSLKPLVLVLSLLKCKDIVVNQHILPKVVCNS